MLGDLFAWAFEPEEPSAPISPNSSQYQGCVKDNYDPRDPSLVTPATVEEVERKNKELLDRQIQRLASASKNRGVRGQPAVLDHYTLVLQDLRRKAGYGGVGLQRRHSSAHIPEEGAFDSEEGSPGSLRDKRTKSMPQMPIEEEQTDEDCMQQLGEDLMDEMPSLMDVSPRKRSSAWDGDFEGHCAGTSADGSVIETAYGSHDGSPYPSLDCAEMTPRSSMGEAEMSPQSSMCSMPDTNESAPEEARTPKARCSHLPFRLASVQSLNEDLRRPPLMRNKSLPAVFATWAHDFVEGPSLGDEVKLVKARQAGMLGSLSAESTAIGSFSEHEDVSDGVSAQATVRTPHEDACISRRASKAKSLPAAAFAFMALAGWAPEEDSETDDVLLEEVASAL